MPRIQLEALPAYPFRCELDVRTADLNYGGHLGHDRMLALAQEARVAFLATRDWTEMNCGGVGLILGDAAIVYRGEAFAGDCLTFEVAAGAPDRCGFRLFYRVTRSGDGAIIALIETGMICFDYGERRVLPLPTAVKSLCET